MLTGLLDRAKAVLFDFDGVLVDSERFYYQSYNMAFQKIGHSIKKEEYWEFWTSRGEGIRGEAKRYNLDISDEEFETIYAERCENFTRFCAEGKIPFFPGMLEALLTLKRKGLLCAIGSSSFEKDIHMIFDKAGHRPAPCAIVGRGKGLRPKPHPDIYVYAAGKLGVPPCDCLVIEDAHKGLEAAKAVGMRCAVLKSRLNRNLDYPGADCVVDDHEEFAAAVAAWKGKS